MSRGTPAFLLVLALFMGAGVTGAARRGPAPAPPAAPPPPAAVVAPADPAPLPAARPPAGLPVIDYWTRPRGFPADPAPGSTAVLSAGLHPTRPIAVYDRPGGRPRAFLPSSISGLPVIVPIVARDTGWVAVLLPSVNRRIGWVPEHEPPRCRPEPSHCRPEPSRCGPEPPRCGTEPRSWVSRSWVSRSWVSRTLRDHLLLRRRTHRLTWLRDGAPVATWTVATGTAGTPTPLGRTFVLGRTKTSGTVYGEMDALALASIPDNRRALPPGLRDAHTGIHSWYRDDFGRSSSNGCIRVPKAGQRTLLRHIEPGTPVTVTD